MSEEPPPAEPEVEPEWVAVCHTCKWRSWPGSKQAARTARLDHLLIAPVAHDCKVTVVDAYHEAEP